MRLQRRDHIGGSSIFFRLVLCDESLANMMNTNFAMMQNHQYSLTELENMIPWERSIYVALLANHMVEENARLEQQNKSH